MDKNTLEKIKNDTVEKMLNKYFYNDPNNKPVMQAFLEEFLNLFMLAELNIYLNNNIEYLLAKRTF
ncbi:hypothetical protein ACAG39_05065 [Caldicellulosiruptoraceae bacterium PP1]